MIVDTVRLTMSGYNGGGNPIAIPIDGNFLFSSGDLENTKSIVFNECTNGLSNRHILKVEVANDDGSIAYSGLFEMQSMLLTRGIAPKIPPGFLKVRLNIR